MVVSIFVSLLILLFMIFCSYRKRLHIFEILFIWMTVWLITHSVSSILLVNLEALALSTKTGHVWTHVLKRLLFYPLVIVIFLDLCLRFPSTLVKIMIVAVTIVIMSGLELVFIAAGVLINKHYHFAYSLLEWTFTLLLTLLSWAWYRKKCLLG